MQGSLDDVDMRVLSEEQVSALCCPRTLALAPRRGCECPFAAATCEGRLGAGASAVHGCTADREQRGATCGAVTLPAGATVGQGHLPRIGDGDLLATDTPALRALFLCLCARVNHGDELRTVSPLKYGTATPP